MEKTIYFDDNMETVEKWKKEGKIRFVPPTFTLNIFPPSCFGNYIKNGNHKRWASLVKETGFYKLDGKDLEEGLIALMNIYYALGGFSDKESERERAYSYVLNSVAVFDEETTPKRMVADSDVKDFSDSANLLSVATDMYIRFCDIDLRGEYNKAFAQFFMKYYHKNRNFMKLALKKVEGVREDFWDFMITDIISEVHNKFPQLLEKFPNYRVNTNDKYGALTPEFVAKNYKEVGFFDVHEGNEKLADLIGKYGYRQRDFEVIQEVFDRAKKEDGALTMRLNKTLEGTKIDYRILSKDDPLGFVIGHITNCCQFIGGLASSCVVDGYENPNSGFLLFEETKGEEKRIIGQAYVWYDENEKMVCYDSIEVPKNIVEEMKEGETITIDDFLNAVKSSADAIIEGMNNSGHSVEKVTLGKFGYSFENGLNFAFLKEDFDGKKYRRAYTDVGNFVYVIKKKEDLDKIDIGDDAQVEMV